MDKELVTQNVNNRFFTESCSDGIERIVDSKNNSPFKIPHGLIKRRKQFWDDFFKKYTKELSVENEIDLKDSYASRPHKKSLSFIQHWIDNGTLPYKSMQSIDKQWSSSSSSVDTTAYILSNMNTTNKINTMAIVEGAKHSTLVDIENKDSESMETIKLNKDEMYGTHCVNGNSVQLNSVNSSTIPSSENETIVIYERSVDPKEATTEVQKNLHAHTNDDIRASKLAYDKLFNETLMHLISKTVLNSSLHTEINESSQTYISEENSTLQNDSTKLSQRKKLYSSTDSPVDIVFRNSTSKYIIPKSKRCLHPALDTEHNIKTSSKFLMKRRARRMNMYRESMMTNSMLSFASKNTRKKSGSRKYSSKGALPNIKGLKNQQTKSSSIEANNTVIEQNNHNMDSSLIISNGSEFGDSVKSSPKFKKVDSTVQIFKKPKLVDRSRQVSRSDKLKHKKADEVTTQQNLNPVVCLIKLSEIDIKKYKKPKTLISNFNNLLSPVVHLNRLSKSDIQKYKKTDKVVRNVENSAPVICLKQSSLFVPKEDRIVKKTVTIPCQFHTNPTVYPTRLSKRNSKTIILDMNPSELKENNLLSRTTQIQNNDISITKKTSHSQDTSNSLVQNNNIINLFEDTDSSQSTLLIHECENSNSKKLTRNLRSASNVFPKNKLKRKDNKIRKNDTMVLQNNATDKHHDNCIRKTRNLQRNKGIKPNNKKGCGLSFSKSNKRSNNNIDHIQILKDMSDASICSYEHNNRLRSDEVEVVYKNNYKQPRKPEHNKKVNFLILPDDSDEFIKLIPKGRLNKTFRNSLDSDTDASCNTVTRALRSQRGSTLCQSSVKSTFRDWSIRDSRKEVASQKQKNVNVRITDERLDINYLHFQTKFDTDSEASSY